MATIDDQRLVHEVDAAEPTVLHAVLQAHHAVQVARLSHSGPGRARALHRGRRIRHPHASRHRPAGIFTATAEQAATGTDIRRRRRPVPTVVIVMVALTLLFVGFIRLFEPDLNDRGLLVGVFLIVLAAAVLVNAFTLVAMAPPARYTERAVLRAQRTPSESRGWHP